MKFPYLLILGWLLILSPSFAWGEDNTLPLRELTLKECIVLTLKNNLDIKIESYNPRIFDTEVDQALAGETGGAPSFEPTLKANASFVQLRTPTFVDQSAQIFGIGQGEPVGSFVADRRRNMTFNMSLEQRFYTGTSYVLSHNQEYAATDRSLGLNPAYRPSFSLEVRQPLLKNFGLVPNKAQIRIARNNRLVSDETFNLKVISIIQQVETRYWDVVEAYQNLELAKKSREVAKELLRIANLRFQMGTVPSIEVTAAKSGLASRKAQVIEAQNRWRNASDQLIALFLKPEDLKTYEKVIKPLDQPGQGKKNIPLAKNIKVALGNRSELVQAQLELSNRQIQLDAAWYDLLPQFDVSVGLTFNGIGGDYVFAFRQIKPTTFYDWNITGTFSYPLFQEGARARYRKAELERKQSLIKIRAQRRDVILQVRQSVRDLLTARQSYLAREEASRFALEKLEGERTRYSVGKSTNHQVFQIEEEYTEAKTQELAAKVAIAKARVAFDVARGTLLKRYKIQLDNLLPPRE